MAELTAATNQQTMEFVVNGPGNANRVFITTGMAPVSLAAVHPGGEQQLPVSVNQSFRLLMNPILTAGQFHKATATASIAAFAQKGGGQSVYAHNVFTIGEVEATWDDESGQIQLRIDASVQALDGATTILTAFAFQVTTLAAV